MEDKNNYTQRLTATINKAYKQMLERKARLGEMVHTDDGTGVMRTQRAIDVYHRIYVNFAASCTTNVTPCL